MWNKVSGLRYLSLSSLPERWNSINIISKKVDQSGFGGARKRVSLTALDTG